MTQDLVPPEVWADEGRRLAPSFHDVAAAILTGRDPEAVAAVALGLAKACGRERRVAVADLVGGIPALTPLDEQPGLLECLRDGYQVSDIGQPLADAPEVYVLPSGQGPIAERWVFESARWERLVAGFREVDALLLLVTPPAAPGLDALIGRVDGVVAVDLPPTAVRAWPLLAMVDHPEPELPPIPVSRPPTPAGEAAVSGRKRRKVGRWVLAGLVAVGGLGTWLATQPPAIGCDGRPIADVEEAVPACRPEHIAEYDSLVRAGAITRGPALGDSAALGAIVEVTDLPLVNPGDSAVALRFSVELVAGNTPESANSRLASAGDPYPLPTIAPVVLRAGTAPWYRAVVGAWATRAEAEAWLNRQRSLGLLRAAEGRVVDTPWALQLAEGLPAEVAAVTAQGEGVGLRPYTLEQADGRVRVLAGAFETASQALWFATTLRERGLEPQLAYRTGRTF